MLSLVLRTLAAPPCVARVKTLYSRVRGLGFWEQEKTAPNNRSRQERGLSVRVSSGRCVRVSFLHATQAQTLLCLDGVWAHLMTRH